MLDRKGETEGNGEQEAKKVRKGEERELQAETGGRKQKAYFIFMSACIIYVS